MKRASAMRPGFTLVELLVVVGIISVLIAIVVPAIKGVRENARRAHCASNFRQIHQGALAYANRYNGALPGVVTTFMHDSLSTGDPGVIAWAPGMHREMFKFIDGRLMRCPSDTSVSPYNPYGSDDWRDIPPYAPQPGHNHTSFFMFMGVSFHPDTLPADPDGITRKFPPLPNRGCLPGFDLGSVHLANLKDIRDPKQILMMDRYYSELQTGYYYDYGMQSALAAKLVSNHPSSKQLNNGSVTLILAAGSNVLLADGSVRWMGTQNEARTTRTPKKVYHRDYYFQVWVDPDLHWHNWRAR